MSQTHIPETGGARLRFFGPKAQFPRAGAWVIAKSRLGVIFRLAEVVAEDGTVVPSAEVHFIKQDGTTEMKLDETTMRITSGEVLPVAEIRQATYAEMHAHPRHSNVPAHEAGALGYKLDESHIKALTALQRKQLGLLLDDADKAQAELEQAKEDELAKQRAIVATHPDAIALEAQIETERLAFIASVEARRQAMHDQIVAAAGK